ncbi:MAG: hypothetical protein M1820_001718 [Bogoriella megaspora]|nr:MAG: hypothetical protein M1820_001718 [Bogoriella megaspora]
MSFKEPQETKLECDRLEAVEGTNIPYKSNDSLQRRLGNRQVQLAKPLPFPKSTDFWTCAVSREIKQESGEGVPIGGSIGTAVFVSISNGLAAGGPGSLLIAFMIATVMMGLVNNCMAEMSVYQPVNGAFISMAGYWVDEALGFLAGWNFFLYEAILVPFEISALNLVLHFWTDKIPVEAVVIVCIVLYILINVFAVQFYGESEFWLSTGKLILFLIVFLFTLVTMSGGNPKHDAYGFRHWSTPGAFARSVTKGELGRFEGFLAALWNAVFTVCGPEYMSMVAAETKFPRKYLKDAYKTTFYRFAVFFVGSALCVGVVVAYDDPTLVAITSGTSGGAGTAAASPYVIAMSNLGIGVLPHITNALLVTSIFSAGNAYTYCGSRSLYSLALNGKAPKFFLHCTKSGVPIFCLGASLLFALLAFLSVSTSSAKVLDWLINLLSSSQIINYIIMCITYLSFYRATKVQNFTRRSLPYYGYLQPYGTWVALVFYVVVLFVRGYTAFLPGKWDIATFFTSYTMVGVGPLLFLGWKIVKRTRFVKPSDTDLVWEAPLVDTYEANLMEDPVGFWTEMVQMFGFKRNS